MNKQDNKVFQISGAISADSPVYVKREAEDIAIQELISQMAYLKIIEPRQQGKTSLIHWLSKNLKTDGFYFIYVDVSTLGLINEADWYVELCDRLLAQVDFIPDHDDIFSLITFGKWRRFLATLAKHARSAGYRIVIALDEIGTTQPAWAEAFFRILRDVFNSRQSERYFEYLSFILAGCYNPADLISSNNESPFNVAIRIHLPDFTYVQVHLLVDHLLLPEEQAELVSERIYYWTEGHPSLTQCLCRYLTMQKQPLQQIDVDNAVGRLYREDKNHLPPILSLLEKATDLKNYVIDILGGYKAKFLPSIDSQRHAPLELIGVIKGDSEGYCVIRNRIYEMLFSKDHSPGEHSVQGPKKVKVYRLGKTFLEDDERERIKEVVAMLIENGSIDARKQFFKRCRVSDSISNSLKYNEAELKIAEEIIYLVEKQGFPNSSGNHAFGMFLIGIIEELHRQQRGYETQVELFDLLKKYKIIHSTTLKKIEQLLGENLS